MSVLTSSTLLLMCEVFPTLNKRIISCFDEKLA